MTFEAKYRGECAGCGHPIEVGQMIFEYRGEYAHVECDVAAAYRRRPADVCQECFLEKPCGCED